MKAIELRQALIEANDMNLNGADALVESSVLKQLMDEVARVRGTFSSIWHNENLSEMFGWEGWRSVYEQMLDYGETLKTNKI